MRIFLIYLGIGIATCGVMCDAFAAESENKTPHKFNGNIELQYRSNTNITVAPASGESFDFADLSEFGEDDLDDELADEEEDEDGEDNFDDVIDAELADDEISEEGPADEDSDGIDDLLDPDSEGIADSQNRITAKFGLGHKYKFFKNTMAWNNGVKLALDNHEGRSDLNKFNYAFTTGLEFSPKGSKHKLKPSISYVTLEKDDSKFVSTFVVSLGYEYDVTKRLGLSATYNYQDKDITNPNSPDARIDTVSLGADFKATANDIFKVKYAPKFEDSTLVTRNTDASGWEFTYTRKLPWDVTAGFGFKYDTIEYKNLMPVREDDNTTYALQLTKDFSKKFGVALGFESRDRDSNIPAKNSRNRSVYVEGTYKFGG